MKQTVLPSLPGALGSIGPDAFVLEPDMPAEPMNLAALEAVLDRIASARGAAGDEVFRLVDEATGRAAHRSEAATEAVEGVADARGPRTEDGSSNGASPDKGGKPDRGGKPDGAGKPDNGGRPDGAGRPEDAGKPEDAGRPDKAGGPGKGGKPEKDGPDDEADGGTDSGPDTGGDTGTDTGTGGDTDTGGDTGTDTGTDTGDDTGGDTGDDTVGDTGTDTGGDTGTDTGGDPGTDAGTDTGGETESTPVAYTPPTEILTSYTSGLGTYGVVSDFNIELSFVGTWTTALQEAFIEASEFISTLITGDVLDVGGIDDLRIEAELTSIDGSGGILGQAGPTYVRGTVEDYFLPTEGIMQFDSADAEYFDGLGLFDDIALHEMLHVTGFGVLWSYLDLTSGSVEGGDYRFTGGNATLAYNTEFADLAAQDSFSDFGVPIEMDGGAGTAGGHWDEALFADELMTGYINYGNYLSAVSVASLEDLGYETIFDPYDPTADVPQLTDEFLFA